MDTSAESQSPKDLTALRLIQVPQLVAKLARHPIDAMKQPMKMTWPAAISLQAGAAMVSGALVGLFSGNFWDFLIGILLFPVTSVLAGFIFSLFIFQFFSIFRSTLLDFQHIHSIVVLATLPYYFVHIASSLLSPLDLIGFALTCILLVVGLVEQFGLDRRFVLRVMVGIFLLFFVAWAGATLTAASDSSAAEAAGTAS